MLGYCVARGNCRWNIFLYKVGYEEARMFVRGTENCNTSNCGKIVSLDVADTKFELVPLTTLPPCLSTELTNFTTFACGGLNDLAEFVLHTPQLHKLHLTECTFPPGSAVKLLSSLCSLHSFTTLIVSDVAGHDLSPEDCQALGRLLFTSKSLTKLDISGRSLVYTGIEYISNGLKQSTLLHLDLSSCDVDSDGACLIADALCYNDTLRKIDIDGNTIGDDGATALAQVLIRNQTLNTLSMQGCDITELGAIKLAEALCINSTLTKFSLSRNVIKDQGASALAQMLTRNQSLCELDIQVCSISGVGAHHLARALLTNRSIAHM